MKSETQVVIRPAVSSDKGRVLEFCKNTWPGGDYIPQVWDSWRRGPNRSLLVATVRGVPIGLGHVYFQTRNTAWLEGLRVDPAYRGLGIAGRLNRALSKYALVNGAKIARLCTGIQNIASQRHVEKVGFTILQRFERLDSTRALQRKPTNVSQLHDYRLGLWKFVRLQPEFSEFRGLYSDGWTWYPITSLSLRNAARHSKVLVTRSHGEIGSLTIISMDERRLTLGFFAGDRTHAEHVALYSRYGLAGRKFQKARALIPHGSALVGAFKKAGFKPTNSIFVYEKSLEPSRQKE